MDITGFRWLLMAGLLVSFTLAGTRLVSADGTGDPNAAAPAAVQLQYISVFTHYQFFEDQPLVSWQETNDNAGKIGGWRFYARDAMQPETDTSDNGARYDAEEKQPSGQIRNSDQPSEHGRQH